MNERDDMELKRALDGLPRSIEPPADLWPGVRGRLKAKDAKALKRSSVIRIAALLTLLALSATALSITRQRAGTWRVASADGGRIFTVGEALATGDTRQVLTVGTIGSIEADTATSLRLLAARSTQHRLSLERGTIHAVISAPPRLFIVETPSGTAVDLGCAYTLDVDSLGNSTIIVTAGWVAFEQRGIQSLIPAGMRATARRGGGLGTPLMEDAPAPLRDAVLAYDAAPTDTALGDILRNARSRDAVSLWHLVQRTSDERRARVVTRLLAMVPLPSGVSRAQIERAEPHAMELYWTMLPGTLPILSNWQQALWKLWLRVAG